MKATQLGAQVPSLSISDNGRYITTEDGKPFFWLGDTAWELYHRLTLDEAKRYIDDRAEKGFTVIQAVYLAELKGLTEATPDGYFPLRDLNPELLHDDYFDHVDKVIAYAEEQGMYTALLPTWGDKFNKKWGEGPEIFTPENAYKFAKLLAERFRDRPIIWMLGGDRIPEEEEDFQIIDAMAQAIRDVVGNKQLITYHPQGGYGSHDFFHDREWLDFHTYQSGHGRIDDPVYWATKEQYDLTPMRPAFNSEPAYEDHPIKWNPTNGWFDAFDVRQAAYWSLLEGAAGHTYGNHNIWQMYSSVHDPISAARTPWWEALDYPGSYHMGILRTFWESFDWWTLTPTSESISEAPNGNGREVRAAMTGDKKMVIVYTPYGDEFTLDLSIMDSQQIDFQWFDPRVGSCIDIGRKSITSLMTFDPPQDPGRGNDWILIGRKVTP